ncbi:MAG: ornithine cyclodeaminase family protein [Planctomycetes bacterium]|nr:ornithine cyclodeaminase family protein [Planctomycetota bacterium]
MPFLLLNESDVRGLLTMDMALEAVEEGLRKVGLDEAMNIPRARAQTDHAMLHVMSASAKTLGVMGYKAYTTSRRGTSFHVGLFDGKSGELTAIVQADYLGQVRTGAASGVATRLLARPEAATVGLYGAGKQARTQLLAVCQVRAIKNIAVYARNPENLKTFCEQMAPLCQCPVEPAARPEDAARGKDIVITATSSRDPVLLGEWLENGAHLNIIGSNFLAKSEIDVATVRRAQVIIVDGKEQAHIEAGDFREAIDTGALLWKDVRELSTLVAGRCKGRETPEQITLFKSLGLAIEDVATAAKVVARAKEKNVGRWLEW